MFTSLIAIKQLANGSFVSRHRGKTQLKTAVEENAFLRMHKVGRGLGGLALQGWHFFRHIVAANYIIFRVILIVSNNCYQVKVMFEVLGKPSLCWLHFPWAGLQIHALVRASPGHGFVRHLEIDSSSVWFLHPLPSDFGGSVTVTGVGGLYLWLLFAFFGRVKAVSIFPGIYVDSSASIEPAGWKLSPLVNGSWVRGWLLRSRKWSDCKV